MYVITKNANERKSSISVKSQICHFIKGYLIPLPSKYKSNEIADAEKVKFFRYNSNPLWHRNAATRPTAACKYWTIKQFTGCYHLYSQLCQILCAYTCLIDSRIRSCYYFLLIPLLYSKRCSVLPAQAFAA